MDERAGRAIDAAPGIGLIAGAALATFVAVTAQADLATLSGIGAAVGLVAGAAVRALIRDGEKRRMTRRHRAADEEDV